jgi:hypothetical protein
MPRVRLRRDPQWPAMHKTFGRYNDENKTLKWPGVNVTSWMCYAPWHTNSHTNINTSVKAIAWVLTLEKLAVPMKTKPMPEPVCSCVTMVACIPEYFAVGQAHDLEESASGYIPTKAQAKDPRFSMALDCGHQTRTSGQRSQQVKIKTDRQGHPQIARANGLFENFIEYEYKQRYLQSRRRLQSR